MIIFLEIEFLVQKHVEFYTNFATIGIFVNENQIFQFCTNAAMIIIRLYFALNKINSIMVQIDKVDKEGNVEEISVYGIDDDGSGSISSKESPVGPVIPMTQDSAVQNSNLFGSQQKN